MIRLFADAAWSLSVVHKQKVLILAFKAYYISLHVPQTNDTKGFINADRSHCEKGVVF